MVEEVADEAAVKGARKGETRRRSEEKKSHEINRKISVFFSLCTHNAATVLPLQLPRCRVRPAHSNIYVIIIRIWRHRRKNNLFAYYYFDIVCLCSISAATVTTTAAVVAFNFC